MTNYSDKRIIIITGTPGVGKTEISKALSARLGASYANLEDIVRDENLVSETDKERRTPIVNVRRLSKRIKEIILSSPKDIVIEGHYAPDVVSSKIVSSVFVFRRDPEELEAEFQARGYDEKKTSENITSELLDVCLVNAIEKYGIEKVDEIDVTRMDTYEVVERVLMVINKWRKPRVGVVDWLGKLDKDGRLDKILSLLEKT
jgi:adenylate kinase